mmetsp:Transcript_14938/g.28122  ORF Transcript_14938/g.28122 Transcript_14938/m.28122 type:complete len:557 (-) Transcript_14938:172-1842(-)
MKCYNWNRRLYASILLHSFSVNSRMLASALFLVPIHRPYFYHAGQSQLQLHSQLHNEHGGLLARVTGIASFSKRLAPPMKKSKHDFYSFRLFSTVGDNSSIDIIDVDAQTRQGDSNDWFVTNDDDDDGGEENNFDDYNDDEEEEENGNDYEDNQQETELKDDTIPSSDPLTDKHNTLLYSIEKAMEKNTKKRDALQKELDKAKTLEDTMKRANLIVSNLYQLSPGVKSAIVQDWDMDGQDVELVLNYEKYQSAQEEADALFAAARKMKRGTAVVGELILETERSLMLLEEAKGDLEHVNINRDGNENENVDVDGYLSMILHRLERSSKQTGFYLLPSSSNVDDKKNNNTPNTKKQSTENSNNTRQPLHNCRKFRSPAGCIVLVGRNRRDNEAICFQIAKGDDIWMHARGCPGAHVLLQVRTGSPIPTDSCLQFAANLAAFFSDWRTERKADVTMASPKHILKPRGAPLGAVKIRQELNTMTGYPSDVDEELKVAREKSGVFSSWDESSGLRSFGGKVKNQKKTRENVKQITAKKRAEKRAKKKRRQSSGGGGMEDE